MSYLTQKTLKNSVKFSGVALHSGINVNLIIKPAQPNFGIVFKRTDITSNNLVYPNFMNVTNTSLNTTIENEYAAKVSTIEHLMGALFCLGIDNALIEIDNEEVPILDGSAKCFIDKIISAGIDISESPIKIIKINKEVKYSEGDRFISIKPSTLSLDIDFEINYENEIIGNQKNKVKVYEDDLTNIYTSRTFCLFEDIELIKKNGLAKGGSLENAVVVKNNKILNSDGLRNKKEFVNHKILDLAGDFLLSGYRILGKVYCYQGGHQLSNMFLRKLLKSSSSHTEIELNNIELSKKTKVNPAIKLAVNA